MKYKYIFLSLLLLDIANSFIITPKINYNKNNIIRLKLKKNFKNDFFNDFPLPFIKKNNTIIKKYDNYNDDKDNDLINPYYFHIVIYCIFAYYSLIFFYGSGII